MKRSDQILFILTGGTIDSHWEGHRDTVTVNDSSDIPYYIKSLKLYSKLTFKQILMKDSRDLNDTDRYKILRTLERSPFRRIIITHGTYTMPKTAKFLKTKLKRRDQTIVLTGAMAPLSSFTISDAPFNLGYAIGKTQELPGGVYVCMNGKVFTADEAEKDTARGRFYSARKR